MRRITFNEIEGLNKVIVRIPREYLVAIDDEGNEVIIEDGEDINEELDLVWKLKDYDENNPETYDETVYAAGYDGETFVLEPTKSLAIPGRYVGYIEEDDDDVGGNIKSIFTAKGLRISIWDKEYNYFYTEDKVSGPKRIRYEEGLV